MKPLAIDLFCGLGGWAEGFVAEGYRVIGFDINPRFASVYPGEFVLADVPRPADLRAAQHGRSENRSSRGCVRGRGSSVSLAI